MWLQSTDAFTVLGVASLVAAAVRLISSIVDRSVTLKNIGGVVAEACLGTLFGVTHSWDESIVESLALIGFHKSVHPSFQHRPLFLLSWMWQA